MRALPIIWKRTRTWAGESPRRSSAADRPLPGDCCLLPPDGDVGGSGGSGRNRLLPPAPMGQIMNNETNVNKECHCSRSIQIMMQSTAATSALPAPMGAGSTDGPNHVQMHSQIMTNHVQMDAKSCSNVTRPNHIIWLISSLSSRLQLPVPLGAGSAHGPNHAQIVAKLIN